MSKSLEEMILAEELRLDALESRVRWETGRKLLRAVEDGAAGARAEIVGLLFDTQDYGPIWCNLQNEATVGESEDSFRVSGEALQALLVRAEANFGPCKPAVLWHNHYRTQEPSAIDIEAFPGWLVDLAVVYHVPSDAYTVYNGSGVLHRFQHNADTSSASASVVDHEVGHA